MHSGFLYEVRRVGKSVGNTNWGGTVEYFWERTQGRAVQPSSEAM